jgi:hypothetical protein
VVHQLHFGRFSFIIEHMSQVFFTLAQFIYILWPLFVLTALVYSLQITGNMRRSRSKRWLRALTSLVKRIRNNLLMTWIILFFFWFITLFAPGPVPTLLPEPWNSILFLGGFLLLVLSEASELGLFDRRLRARVEMHHDLAIQDLKRMDPYDFEHLVSETYRLLGYQVQHIGHSGDHGVDVELRTKEGGFWVVQCKRYDGSVGEGVVRELYGTMTGEKADRAVLVTTAEITGPARAWARGKPIDLVDGRDFLDLMARARQKAEGTLFDRAALFLERLLMPQRTPPALRAAQNTAGAQHSAGAQNPAVGQAARSTAEMNHTQPVAPQAGSQVYPAGRTRPLSASNPASQPAARGAPLCPNCRVPMLPRPPRPGERAGRVLYRCRNYPQCRVVLEEQRAEV